MKRLFAFLVAAAVVAGAASVYAGGACCAAGKDKKTASAKADCFAKLNLTDEQKAKLATLKAECDKTECTQTSHEKFMSGVKEILTAEQLTAWQADCEKMGKSGAQCPYSRSSGNKADKQG
jgi:Spy/CpxP family protein refolding chaperone